MDGASVGGGRLGGNSLLTEKINTRVENTIHLNVQHVYTCIIFNLNNILKVNVIPPSHISKHILYHVSTTITYLLLLKLVVSTSRVVVMS